MSSERRQWIPRASVSTAAAEAVAASLNVPRAMGLLLAARNLADPAQAARFMQPRLSGLTDPFLLSGMAAASERIWRAIGAGERIVVFGDFDADGVTSTALLVGVLRRLGADVGPFLPCRFADGYGLTLGALQRCAENLKPSLVITVDCGSGAGESVAWARGAGIDVVVTDHHECAHPAADAVAVVNPKLDAFEDLRMLAGVGVAFKLCHALVKQGIDQGHPAVHGLDLREVLPLVAVGTVADVVPLLGENRVLVRHGLQRLASSPPVGLKALLDVAGVKGAITTYHIGFVLGPRLNAAGRLESAQAALDLLLAGDAREAERLAGILDAANRERQRIEKATLADAVKDVEQWFDDTRDMGLVVAARDWHIGTIGLVASRLCSRFRRPAVVISLDGDGEGRGSCRGVEGLDLLETLSEAREHLVSFGGHKMAAGLDIRESCVTAFRAAFNAACRQRLAGLDLRPVAYVDAVLSLGEADWSLHDAIESLAPFGVDHPRPLWQANGVRLVGPPRRVGQDGRHLKLVLASGGMQRDAPLPDGPLDILFHLESNTFRGRTSLQLNVQDFRASE